MTPRGQSPRRESSRSYYEKNREAILRKARERRASGQTLRSRRLRRERVRAIIVAAKDVPCADCGVRYPPVVMDLDHVRGEKVASVARMAADDASVDAIIAEIAKCEVRCSNCHRLKHAP
jgi:hypothetical protein